MYCWRLTWRILTITLLAYKMSAIVQQFEHSLALPFFGLGMKTDLSQTCGHCWVFQICWHIECSTFTALSFRIWTSSTGIPSPPLALFIVMLLKAHLALQQWSSELNLPIPIHFSSLIPKMSIFILAIISSLTTSNLPWFMDLTFQVPKQYCSLQLWVLLSLQDSSSTGQRFRFGSASSFLLELFLHSSPVAYWAPIDLGGSFFSVMAFCLFILFMGFQDKNVEVVCHSLLQWTMFCQISPPWPVHLGWPYMSWLIVSLSYTKLWSTW